MSASAGRPPGPNLDPKYSAQHEVGATWAEVTEGTDLLGGAAIT